MPLHVWLPRAHPIAPAPVSALMSGVMIKVAIYGLVRVLVEWLGVAAGVVRRARARARRALGGRRRRLRAVPARPQAAARVPLDRERRDHRARARRLPAAARARRRRRGRRSRSRRRCCTRSTTRSSRRCCSSAPGAFERAVGSLELDRLGGLLRRMPWTGGAFLVGAMAIAGLPPLNGFASEWLTLQSLLHVPGLRRRRRRARGRDRARRARGDRGARGVLLRQGRRARAARPAAARAAVARGSRGAARRCAARRRRARGGVRRARRRARAAVRLARRPRAVAAPTAPAQLGLHLPGTGSLPTGGIALVLVGLAAALVLLRGAVGRARRRRAGRAASSSSRRSTGRAPGSRSRCGSCSRPCCARSGRSSVRSAGGVVQEVALRGSRPAPVRRHGSTGPSRALALARRGTRAAAAERQPRRRTSPTSIGLVLVLLAAARIGVIG